MMDPIKQIVVREVKNPCVYLFVLFTLVLNVAMIVASKYTSAVYVQLFIVFSPFVISIGCLVIAKLHRLIQVQYYKIANPEYSLFEEEKLNWLGLAAMIVAIVGGILVIIGGITNAPTTWYSFIFEYRLYFDMLTSSSNSNPLEFVGIAFAAIACLSLSCYLLIIRYSKIRINKYNIPSVLFHSGEVVLVLQLCLLSLFILPSLILEDWKFWLQISYLDLLLFAVLSVIVFLLGNLLMIRATQQLGPVVTGAMIPLRLLSSILASSLILADYLKSIYQAMGACVAMIGIFFFLFFKYRLSQQQANAKQQTTPATTETAQVEQTAELLDVVAEQQQPDEATVETK